MKLYDSKSNFRGRNSWPMPFLGKFQSCLGEKKAWGCGGKRSTSKPWNIECYGHFQTCLGFKIMADLQVKPILKEWGPKEGMKYKVFFLSHSFVGFDFFHFNLCISICSTVKLIIFIKFKNNEHVLLDDVLVHKM